MRQRSSGSTGPRPLHLLAAAAFAAAFAAPARATPAAPAAPTRTLEVAAAASLAEAFGELAALFEKRESGIRVRLNTAGTPLLVAQIGQGARADVFAAADEAWMRTARERGLIEGEPSVFARNRLVVVVPRANKARIGSLHDLARPGVKLVLGAESVPVGRYSRRLLANLAKDPAYGRGYAAAARRNVVSAEENVKSVLAKVQLGEADAGIVYRSDVTAAVQPQVRVFDVPPQADVVAHYPIALVKGGREPEAARAFVALVHSPEGQRVLTRHGLLVGSPSAP